MAAAAETTEYFEDDTGVDLSQFKLPDKVEMAEEAPPSHEEDEDVVYETVCRLYRFRDDQWRERGKGDVRILKHRETDVHRLIMREAGTQFVRANHVIDPEQELRVPEGEAGARFRFDALDYADGDSKIEQLIIRFKDAEAGAVFKGYHDAARSANTVAIAKKAASSGDASASSASASSASSSSSSSSTSSAAPAAAKEDTSGPVPESGNLAEAWSADDAERIDRLSAAFTEKFGAPPAFFVHAPGRVNVIGEHIDYHLFSVLPFALKHDIVFAVGDGEAGSSTVQLENMSDSFASAEVPADPEAKVERDGGVEWQHYFQGGYKAAFSLMTPGTEPKPMRVLVDGRVPPGGGVSSSSALSVGSCLATLKHHGQSATRVALATAAQHAEAEAVGTMSGGMDQAISCLGEEGKAMRIDFQPLAASPANIPSNAGFVVANSLAQSTKAISPQERYNKRVTEGLLALKLMAKKEGIEGWKGVEYMRDFAGLLKVSTPGDLVPVVEKHLKDGAYSRAELEAEFGEDLTAVMASSGRAKPVGEVLAYFAADANTYELRKRMRHVATEAQRVLDFQDVCNSAHDSGTLGRLGALMDESHASCRDDYECSADELERLVDVAKKAGALGARLTGAGWGGCVVALVEAGQEDALMAAMDAEFYTSVDAATRDAARFATKPSPGAAVFVPEDEEF